MDRDRSLEDVERFFMEQFHQQWFFWSNVTRRSPPSPEEDCHRKQGFRDLPAALAGLGSLSGSGVSRYQLANPGAVSSRTSGSPPPSS
jgi:hypothetical protein